MITILNLSQRIQGMNDVVCHSLIELLSPYTKDFKYIKTRELKIGFCNNCRLCMKSPGNELGVCHLNDDMDFLVKALLASDCILVSSPINCYDLPSILKIILERMSIFCYWGDAMYAPKVRDTGKNIKGILVTTSALPGFMVPIVTKARKTFRLFAKPLRIRGISYYHLGFKGRKTDMALREKDSRILQKIFKKIICEA